MTPEQIRAAGLRALTDALGADGTLRFLLQFSSGSGDYTADRQAWVDSVGFDEILDGLEHLRTERRNAAMPGPSAGPPADSD